MTAALAGALLVGVVALPGMRDALERVMATHMLVQIPLLAVAGALAATGLPVRWKAQIAAWNRGGISGTALALIGSSWWMVPRALDLALASPAMELTKFASLPLLVGAPIALSWAHLGTIGGVRDCERAADVGGGGVAVRLGASAGVQLLSH